MADAVRFMAKTYLDEILVATLRLHTGRWGTARAFPPEKFSLGEQLVNGLDGPTLR
jgi:hypothetical protein